MSPAAIETKESLNPKQTIPQEFQPTLEDIKGLPEIPGQPRCISVAEMSGDSECTAAARANLRARKAGDMALAGTIETKAKPIRNLQEGIMWAKAGDKDGERMVESNIVKEASERMFKARHISDVRLDTDTQGRILQNGQLMDDVQRNAYQLASSEPLIAERTVAEANNNARIKKLNDEGLLDDHVFLVLSRCPDGVSDEKLDKLHFFSNTKSLSIQATTANNGVLHTESAFVAGVNQPGGMRHDRKTVEQIGRLFGIDYDNKSAAEIIDMPILVPKQFMKNGVIDIVKLYDEINGGTFFGQTADARPYEDAKRISQQREASFAEDVRYIKNILIKRAHSLKDAVAASRMLAKLVEERMVKRAIEDDSFDAEVFGVESAEHIYRVRTLYREGDWAAAERHAQLAIFTATGGSCPTALTSLMESLGIETGEVAAQKAERRKLSWHGGKKKVAKCVSCKKTKIVGIASWCKGCIRC